MNAFEKHVCFVCFFQIIKRAIFPLTFSFLQVYTMGSTKEKSDNYKDDLLLRMGLNDNKAGMEGLDKEKINKIILEATKRYVSFSFQYL